MARSSLFSRFSGLAVSLAACLLSTTAAAEQVDAPAASDAPRPWRVALRVNPPLGGGVSTGNLSFGGVALAVTLPASVFVEASGQVLLGPQGLGYGTSVGAGYVFNDRPQPNSWHFSLPAQLAWRHARRPATSPSDGYALLETLDMAALTVRPMVTRTWQRNALELGLAASAGVPFSRRGPDGYRAAYYSDGETKVWLDVGVFAGLSFGL